MASHDEASDLEKIRRLYGRLAPRYDRAIRIWERLLFVDARRWVCRRARGQVLEVGVGTGLNIGLYPHPSLGLAVANPPTRPVVLRHGQWAKASVGRVLGATFTPSRASSPGISEQG